ncbi:MAG: flagellar hook-length control protein FliK, partial [Chloroflexi bacterium]|nr:flagellar hook-length control protein FliK [Chloroflexota bacterium]
WGEPEAELAAALKAAGLPVTAQSLALASRQAAQTGDSLANLIALLTQASQQKLPADLLKQLNSNLESLNALVVQGDGKAPELAKQLKAAAEMLGKSMESSLLEQSQNSGQPLAEKGLVSLLRLQQTLEQSGEKSLARAINEFLTDIRQSQFMNIKPDPVPGRGEWSEIGFMLQSAQQKADEKFSSARLRIAHEAKSDSRNINPAYTRLILQVDLKPGETVEVDLSLVGKQIRTSLIAPNPEWCKQAQNELPSLEQALQALGFILKEPQIGVGNPRPIGGITLAAGSAPPTTVNIEV